MEPGEKSDDMTGSPCPDRELVHLKYFIKNMLPFEGDVTHGHFNKEYFSQFKSNQFKKMGFCQ